MAFVVPLILLLSKALASDIVPALVTDTDNLLSSIQVESNPFGKAQNTNFSKILAKTAENRALLVIFVEETFCSEDISGKDQLGTPFHYLHEGLINQTVKYIPAVKSAYSLLRKQFKPKKFNVFYLQSTAKKFKLDFFGGKIDYFYAFFDDNVNETRVQALRRHDLFMHEIYIALQQLSGRPVVAVYTGKVNPIKVKPLRTFYLKPEARDDVLTFNTDTTLYRFIGMQLLTNGRRWKQDVPIGVREDFNEKYIRSRLEFAGFILEFNYRLDKQEWALENISIWEEGEVVGSLRTYIRAPWGYSYSCHEKLAIINNRDGSVITIPRYQIEPVREWLQGNRGLRSDDDRRRVFRASVDCGPYFSASIVTGLFVVAILLIILFYGIVSILDIRTNSRYDDAHGKQLSFNDASGLST